MLRIFFIPSFVKYVKYVIGHESTGWRLCRVDYFVYLCRLTQYEMLETGIKHTSRLTVDESVTAAKMGSGDMPVLATPAVVALMENAAMNAVAHRLEEGQTTVGGQIDCAHLAPSPLGAEVEAVATLEKVDGRKLFFRVEAREKDKVVAQGTHVRFVVDRQRFLSKL